MKRWMPVILIALICCPLSALAQEEPTDSEGSMIERIKKIAEVITRSEEAREAGVPDEDIEVILEESQKRQLPPEETEEILVETTQAVEESGPVDNFGAFVQAQLDNGLRGRELAAAIHEEHRLHGKGKGHGKGHDKDRGKGHDKGKPHSEDDDDKDGDGEKGKDNNADKGKGKK